MSASVDWLIHEPARLEIMSNLFVIESANATYLLRQTDLTWGNLGSRLAKLEEAGYVVRGEASIAQQAPKPRPGSRDR